MRDARNGQFVRLYFGQFVDANSLQAKLSDRGLESITHIGRIAVDLDDERSGIELLVANLE